MFWADLALHLTIMVPVIYRRSIRLAPRLWRRVVHKLLYEAANSILTRSRGSFGLKGGP